MSCLFNPGYCIQATFWATIGMVPWWGWLIAFAVLLGVAWRLGGIPGLVAAAAGIGFLFGRFRPPSNKPVANPYRHETPHNQTANPDHKPKGGIKPLSAEYKKRMGLE